MLLWLAITTVSLASISAIILIAGNRSMAALRATPPEHDAPCPMVSIIVAARNEQHTIRAALQSLLKLEYPSYELIVVNDRSDDGTQAVLEEMAIGRDTLRLITLSELPAGWLGKNHALWIGSRQASGDLLLFTDADIIMEPTVLSRAVSYLQQHRLDHLVATPALQMPTPFLGMFGLAFCVVFALFMRPWKARDPKSSAHIGIGAFNLVRASAYRTTGGHESIRLRPDDDIKLGKLLKMNGYRQEAVYAPEYLTVEWYASTGDLIRGLEKNTFAGVDYSIGMTLAGALTHLLCSIWPFPAILVTTGVVQKLYLATALVILAAVADSARFQQMRPWYAFGYPVASTLFVYITLRTMCLNLVQGGIRWRGTFYRLKELKKNSL